MLCQHRRMNLLWLEDFQALAETGNFSRAAERRHMTQPAFSRRVRALEDWLGVSLFDRSAQPAQLTEAGEWFRTAASDLLGRVARLPDAARAVADARAATLRFAATHALSLTFLPPWLRGLESGAAPLGSIELVSDVLQQCEALMVQGRAQFLLGHAHPLTPGRLDADGWLSVRVGSDTLLPVALADGGSPRFSLDTPDGVGPPILAYTPESGLGRLLRGVRGAALDAVRAETVLSAHLATVLRSMALDGRGIAWLPTSLVDEDLHSGRLAAAGGPAWRVDLEVRLYRSAVAMPPAAETFWTLACEAAAGVS